MVLDKFIAFPPQLGHGDFSAANTKVLRMFNTLAVDNEAKQSIEALRTELQKTKEKLQAVEELKSQSGIKHKQFTMNYDFFFPVLICFLYYISVPNLFILLIIQFQVMRASWWTPISLGR